jgi:hypothetical protein
MSQTFASVPELAVSASPGHPPRRSRQGVTTGQKSSQTVTIAGYRLTADGRIGVVIIGKKTKKGFRYLGTVRIGAVPGLRKQIYHCLRMLHIYDCPFPNHRDQLPAGLTEAQMEGCVWVEPSIKAWVDLLPGKAPGQADSLRVMKIID